jgi:ABC-2 type transport system permease protein
VRILGAFFRRALHMNMIYRVDFWLWLAGTFVMMYAVYSIWGMLYAQNPDAFGMNVEQMRVYGVLGILLELAMESAMWTQWYIADQVRTGTLELDLLKPLDFMYHMLSSNLGGAGVMILFQFIPGLLFAWLALGFRPPVDGVAAVSFVVSVVLGYLVFFFLNFLFGLLSIVTLDIRSYSWAYDSLVRFTSGQIVPLWMFPTPLRAIIGALPFQAVYYAPMSLYIGAQEGSVATVLGSQALWALALFLLARFAWARVQRRIAIQGG